jgi:hypothetical protein
VQWQTFFNQINLSEPNVQGWNSNRRRDDLSKFTEICPDAKSGAIIDPTEQLERSEAMEPLERLEPVRSMTIGTHSLI